MSTEPAADPTPTTSVSETPAVAPVVAEKVLVFVIENHSFGQVIDAMPYVRGLSEQFAYASDYTAIGHPSLPNYLAIAGGSTFGVTENDGPSRYRIRGSSIFGQAIEAGGTAAVYAEGMTSTCETSNRGDYAVRHNPWVYFIDERELCQKFDVPLDQLRSDIAAGSLPTVGMVVPDVCNDGHDCPLTTADAWYRDLVPTVMSGSDFQSGRLVIVVTADEDDRKHGNRVLTVVMRSGGVTGAVDQPLTHYSLSRLCSEIAGATPLRKAGEASSLSDAFQIPVAAG